MQKFILPNIEKAPVRARILGQDARHIFKVLRMKPGDPISITNGRGVDFSGRITNSTADRIEVDILDSHLSTTEPNIDITLCTGILKDKKMDIVIKHVTQLGIKAWIPFYSERSVPAHNAEKIKRRIERWQNISRESVKQCRRSRLPSINRPIEYTDALNSVKNTDLKIAFWENADQDFNSLERMKRITDIALLIGPEGGFSKQEVNQAKSMGFIPLSLGPRILRAETASICACTLIQHLFGDI